MHVDYVCRKATGPAPLPTNADIMDCVARTLPPDVPVHSSGVDDILDPAAFFAGLSRGAASTSDAQIPSTTTLGQVGAPTLPVTCLPTPSALPFSPEFAEFLLRGAEDALAYLE